VAKDISTYLRDLQAALAGADPALVQDALFDAEEHLQAELAAVEANRGTSADEADARFATVVEGYGTPEEVAAAYLAAPVVSGAPAMSSMPVVVDPIAAPPFPVDAHPAAALERRGVWARFFGVVVDPQAYKALLYMILSLATGIAYFTIVVTGFSLSAGMIVLVIGLPLLLLFLGVVRGLSLLEGRLVEILLGTRMPRRPRSAPVGAGLVQRMWFWLKDGRTWVAMIYMVLQLPLGIAYFTVAVTGFSVGVYLIALPFAQLIVGHTYIDYGLGSEFMLRAWEMPFSVIGGALLLVVWLHIVRGIGRVHAAYAKGMLVRLVK
jgi:hypothetical protein